MYTLRQSHYIFEALFICFDSVDCIRLSKSGPTYWFDRNNSIRRKQLDTIELIEQQRQHKQHKHSYVWCKNGCEAFTTQC